MERVKGIEPSFKDEGQNMRFYWRFNTLKQR